MTSVCKIRCLGFVFVGRLIEIQMFTKVGTCITISKWCFELKDFLAQWFASFPHLAWLRFSFCWVKLGFANKTHNLIFTRVPSGTAIFTAALHTLRCFAQKKSGEQTQKQKNMDLCSIARHRGCLKTEAGAFLKFLKVPADWSSSLRCFGSVFSTFILFFFGGGIIAPTFHWLHCIWCQNILDVLDGM